MSNLKKQIKSKLHEESVDKAAMENRWEDKLSAAKDVVSKTLPNEDPEEIESIAANLATEGEHSLGDNNSDVETDKYSDYRVLMMQLAAEEGEQEQPVKEDGSEDVRQYVNRVGGAGMLRNAKYNEGDKVLMDMGDGSQENLTILKVNYFKPPKGDFSYLYYTIEYGEDMAFLEDMVIKKSGGLQESVNNAPKMSKNKLIETVTGRKIIKTIKVKDIR